MKAQDLRIGNWISFKGKWNGKVFDLRAGSITIENNNGIFTYESFEGIPLTEDILLKCGFNKNISLMSTSYTFYGNMDNHYKTPFEIDIYIKPDGTFETGDDLPMTSVHQLQNYVFARTGKELNVNL